MGRGELAGQMPMDVGNDIFSTLQRIVIPISEHTIAISFQHRSSLRIIARLQGVLTTIDLDRQLRLRTQEVDNVTVDRYLPPEAETLDLPCTQTPPQALLRLGQRLA